MSDDRDGRRQLARILRDDLRAAEIESPPFERLAEYVEGRLSPEERAELDERLADDPVLRAEVEGLRELHRQMTGGRTAVDAPPRRPWVLAGLAAAAAVAALALWLRGPGPERAAERAAVASPTPAPVAALLDGAVRVALGADGSVSGLPALDPAQRAAVAAALRGELPRPGGLDALRDGRQVLMGASQVHAFAPRAPVGTRVTDRPVFRWTAHPDARAYEVTVFDGDFTRRAASGPVTGTEWRPAQPLAEGRVYLWQVAALTSGGRITVPTPPAPEARFQVAAPAVRARIEALRAPAPASHLLAALAFAEAGLLDDAEREVEALAAANPGSPEVAALRERLAALR
jgi:hypothetical protein